MNLTCVIPEDTHTLTHTYSRIIKTHTYSGSCKHIHLFWDHANTYTHLFQETCKQRLHMSIVYYSS